MARSRSLRWLFLTLGPFALALSLFIIPTVVMAQSLSNEGTRTWLGGPLVITPIPDRPNYNLFNPTPDDQLRSFSTDRPGKTHSANTVDPGHFQYEADIFNSNQDFYSPHATSTRSLGLAVSILKLGITNAVDLEIGLDPYNFFTVKDRTTGAKTTGHGFGDTTLGGKINIFGNDGGSQALAVLPFIKLPTAASNIGNGVTEYTLNIPYVRSLDTLWSITLEPGFGLLKNANNNELHGDYSFMANLNRPLYFSNVTAALELAGELSSDPTVTPLYTLDPSLQWLITPTVQLDVGVYLGLNRAAPDYSPYAGISFRY